MFETKSKARRSRASNNPAICFLGGKPPVQPQPIQADPDAIARAKQMQVMKSMAASGRSSTDLNQSTDKMGG